MRTGPLVAFAALVAVLSAASAAQAQASPRLFMAGGLPQGRGYGIIQTDLDGSNERLFANLTPFNLLRLSDLKADTERIFWSERDLDRIGTVSISSRLVNPTLINLRTGEEVARSPTALAIDGSHIYFAWSPREEGSVDDAVVFIGRAKRDGTDVQLNFIAPPGPGIHGSGGITSLATTKDHLYWSNGATGRIGRAKLDGTGIQPDLFEGRGVTVSDGYLYWTTERYIGRARLDGSAVQPRFRRSVGGGASSIAVSRRRLYWGPGDGFGRGQIGRTDLDGSDDFACFYRCTDVRTGLYTFRAELVAVSDDGTRGSTRRCSFRQTSIVWGKTLVAKCPGVSGKVKVLVAGTFNRAAIGVPAGTLDTEHRLSLRVRRARVLINTKVFCRTRFLSDRYRVFFMSSGGQDLGAATIRLRAQKQSNRCTVAGADIDG